MTTAGENAVVDFWDVLYRLTRVDDPDHNGKLVREFSAVSGIAEAVIWEEMRKRFHADIIKANIHSIPGNHTLN
jgi:hypothetical protein